MDKSSPFMLKHSFICVKCDTDILKKQFYYGEKCVIFKKFNIEKFKISPTMQKHGIFFLKGNVYMFKSSLYSVILCGDLLECYFEKFKNSPIMMKHCLIWLKCDIDGFIFSKCVVGTFKSGLYYVKTLRYLLWMWYCKAQK